MFYNKMPLCLGATFFASLLDGWEVCYHGNLSK